MARAFRFRLGEKDAAKFPEGGQLFTFDMERLVDTPAGELALIEAAMDGYTLAQIEAGLEVGSAQALRAAMFTARRLTGVNEKWANFDPLVWRAEYEDVEGGDDTDPPDGAAEPSPPTSEKSRRSS